MAKEAFAVFRDINSSALVHSFVVPETTVGRAPDNMLVLQVRVLCFGVTVQSKSVSSYHAVVIFSKEGSICLKDLGSRNGTFVNEGRIVSGSVLLEFGDVVRFGYCCQEASFLTSTGPNSYRLDKPRASTGSPSQSSL